MKRVVKRGALVLCSVVALAAAAPAWAAESAPKATAPKEGAKEPAKESAEKAPEKAAADKAAMEKNYIEVSQSDLSSNLEKYKGKLVQVKGDFLFTGSDFCIQIRKGLPINTKDYWCFAIGPTSLVRFYLKKDHPLSGDLAKVKPGASIHAFGKFAYLGNDFKYIVVDTFEVEPKK